MNIELLTKFAGFLVEKVTDTNRDTIADFLEKFLVVEIKKLEEPIPEEHIKEALAVPETPARSGNGHKIEKKRDLTGSEKDGIRSWFYKVNGQIENDLCVSYKGDMDPDVAIFQVTGFVTYMHLQVAMGKVILSDLKSYFEFIGHHRNLWATYNSPKYRAMRSRLGLVDPVIERIPTAEEIIAKGW
jgi:hypothetical protein